MTRRTAIRSLLAFVAVLLLPATANAQLFRAYLAPTGSDSNPCTLAAPCRLLPAALAAVGDGGEIWMLDSANYNTGPVNIAKSVTILAVPGALGSVVASGGNAIDITTAGVKVALRNLVIVPLPGGGGGHGIYMPFGAALTVENCLIAHLPGSGIQVTTAASVRVTDTTIRDNGGYGLFLVDGVRGTVTRSTISGNVSAGVYAQGNAASSLTTVDIGDSTIDANFMGVISYSTGATAETRVSVHDSRVVRNTGFGLIAQSNAGASVTLSASNNIVTNSNFGISAFSAGAKVWASGNTVSDNVTGFYNSSGLFESAGNNAMRNNGTNKFATINVITLE